jgi:hypothetical protein
LAARRWHAPARDRRAGCKPSGSREISEGCAARVELSSKIASSTFRNNTVIERLQDRNRFANGALLPRRPPNRSR